VLLAQKVIRLFFKGDAVIFGLNACVLNDKFKRRAQQIVIISPGSGQQVFPNRVAVLTAVVSFFIVT
jgi:hypothetical protein